MNIDEPEGVLFHLFSVVTKLLSVLFSITLKNWQQQFNKNQAAASSKIGGACLVHP